MSGSSPLSLITEHTARFPDISQRLTGMSSVTPFGVGSSTRSAGLLDNSAIAAAFAAAAAQLICRGLLFSIRTAAIGQGSGNRRAVTLYHHICWLARRTKTEVPAEFLEVAEKARFSHHKLSREELQPLQDHADQLTRQLLADKRFWRQFIYRVIYALG